MGERGKWTEEREQMLRDLCAARQLSYTQIARKLGGVTRNSVIGKATRMGLVRSTKRHPATQHVPKSQTRVYRVAPEPAPPPLEEPTPITLEDGSPVTILTVTNRMCRFPLGHPSSPEFRLCGNPPQDHGPYCQFHHKLSRQPSVPQRAKSS